MNNHPDIAHPLHSSRADIIRSFAFTLKVINGNFKPPTLFSRLLLNEWNSKLEFIAQYSP